MVFRCKNCGGNIVYDPARKAMCCPHCDSLDSEDVVGSPIMNTCINCGAPMVYTEHTSATRCPNCETYTILEDRVSGQYKPDMIIPFKISKDVAQGMLIDEFGKRAFTPTGFLSYSSISKMQGHYVPFFMYDYHSDIRYHAIGTKVRTWSDSKYHYTETSYYDVAREMDGDFDKVPVDASIAMDDGTMDLMEPYTYRELEAHQDKYLSGFYAEKYNMEEGEVAYRAEKKVRRDSEELLNNTLGGYATLTNVDKNIALSKQGVKFALLPIWEYVFNYQGVDYKFHVNGQTGKVVGKTPISKGRVLAYGATVFGMLFAAGMLLRMALMVL